MEKEDVFNTFMLEVMFNFSCSKITGGQKDSIFVLR